MDKLGREELVSMYRPAVELLAAYLPWLSVRSGADVVKNFESEDGKVTLPFPVYDDIFLAFLNDLSGTIFMDPNYRYVYSKYGIKDWNDEHRLIARADIMNVEIIKGILSRYMLGGMTKAYLWTDAMDYHIFYQAINRAKEIVEYWDVPIVVEAIGMEETEEVTDIPEAYEEDVAVEAEEAFEPDVVVEAPETYEMETDVENSVEE